MKILAILRPPDDVDVRDAIMQRVGDELKALWRLYADAEVREMYSPGGPGAVLVLEAPSAAAAGDLLQALPLVRDAVMTLELIELHPFAVLQMLFGSSSG